MIDLIKKWNVLKVAMIVAIILGGIGLFLPYERSIGDYRKTLKEYPRKIQIKEVGLTNKNMIDISIMENLKIYSYTMNHHNGDEWIQGESIINVVLVYAMIVSLVLMLLFVIFNRRILTIVFTIVLECSSLLMNFDVVDRGVLPSDYYTFGISYYLYSAITIIILVCTIILMIQKRKAAKIS